MLCTVISDSYTANERTEISDALSQLLARGSPDWSRKGVYAYWDRETHDLMYVGLASDLPSRFAQHNGLVGHGGGNKIKEIDGYFSQKEHLGFTIVIQGAAVAIQDAIAKINPLLGTSANELIAAGEGQLIETHRLVVGRRPPWNKTGGSKVGARFAMAAPALLDVLAFRRDSLFVARRSLRDLARDETALGYEAAIHAARMRAVMEAHEVGILPKKGRLPGNSEEAIRIITRGLMLRDGHLLDELDASDEQIVSWLRRVGDPEYWREEAADARRLFEEFQGHDLSPADRQITDMLDTIFTEAAPPEHVRAIEEVFSTGYLNDEPRLPPSLAATSP
jgi:hypothetical protein